LEVKEFSYFLKIMGQNRPNKLNFLPIFLPKDQNITQVQPRELFCIPYDPLINSYDKVSLKFLVMINEQKSRPAANAPYMPTPGKI
jgi:hypothetical protein